MSEVTITPGKNGPYHVRGKIRVVTPGGRVIATEGDEAWLCRCGHSTAKPFCDGTHKKVGFQSDLDAVATTPSLAGYEDICAEGEVREGAIKGVKVGGQAVVLAREGGQLYAIGGVCTHAQALLEDGELEGWMVSCPLHNSGFDIRTGEAVRLPATEAVPVYDVKVEGGRVFVGRK